MHFHNLWDSAAKLNSLIVIANWGIASTLLVTFFFTVLVIIASGRKDELTEAEASKLRSQLLLQGPRENLLTRENRQTLVDALKPFSGQKIDVRNSASAFLVNDDVVSSIPNGEDTVGLAKALIGVLEDAGWNTPSSPLLSASQGQGIEVEIIGDSSPETQRASQELVKAIGQIPLTVNGPSLIDDDHAERIGKKVVLPAFDKNTIILNVLKHP